MTGRIQNVLAAVKYRLPVIRELMQLHHQVHGLAKDVAALRVMAAVDAQDRARLDPHYADPRRLPLYGAQVNSQNGEDGIIGEIFRRIGTTNRRFVEIGVDGLENNTAFLVAQGWTGWWIDSNPAFVRILKDLPAEPWHRAVTPNVAIVTRENVDELLASLSTPAEPDLLSVDVDQNTHHVWSGIRRFRPRLVVVEYNAAIPPWSDWAAPYEPGRVWNETIDYGAGLKALELLGRTMHYSLVGCEWRGVNAFFVRDDLLGDDFAAPYTAENHFEPARYPAFHVRRGHRVSALSLSANIAPPITSAGE